METEERGREMIAATTIVGIDVSRNWLDGLYLPDQDRFRLPNTT